MGDGVSTRTLDDQPGFANSFYLNDQHAEGDAMNVAAKFNPGDPLGLIGIGGVGIIEGTDDEAAANAFVDFLLSRTAQRYFAEVSLEIPSVAGVGRPRAHRRPTNCSCRASTCGSSRIWTTRAGC